MLACARPERFGMEIDALLPARKEGAGRPASAARDDAMSPRSILDDPLVRFGREVCGDLEAGLRREWLVTNGLGGYASATLPGASTRRYHGLLVAALAPPAQRTVLVAALDEWASMEGEVSPLPLSTHEWADRTIAPAGYRHLESFELLGTLPRWTFALGDLRLEKRVWMPRGANTTFVSYQHVFGTRPLTLSVTPFCTYRDFHGASRGGWQPQVEAGPRSIQVTAWPGARRYRIEADGGDFQPSGVWYWRFLRRVETERGLEDSEDLYAAGIFRHTLRPGERWIVTLSAEPHPAADPLEALAQEHQRQRALLEQASALDQPRFVQQLVLAADQFLVRRDWLMESPSRASGTLGSSAGLPEDTREALGTEETGVESRPAIESTPSASAAGRTVIAGYHWFGDWGRDTMIALPGLTLACGRPQEAAAVLRTFAAYLDQGMLPNRFPDRGEAPEYNTADATLWFFQAIRAYHQASGDDRLVTELLPALVEVVEWHTRGTRHGIRLDEEEGLLRCGESGFALSWMDVRIDGVPWTPRAGKPVEINALWHAALRSLGGWLGDRDDPRAARYLQMADRAATSFVARFWNPRIGYLADVVDQADGDDDLSLRPNQVFAVSLPYPLLDQERARAVVDAVGRSLWTSGGLRSLAPSDAHYQGAYGGPQLQRDADYHQGTVWPWLLGPYAEAHARVYGDRAAARRILHPLAQHLLDAGLGSISELMDGDPPHHPRGCIAQAWSVAETLRVWRALA